MRAEVKKWDYTKLLRRKSEKSEKPRRTTMVEYGPQHNIEIDNSMQTAPTVFNDAQAEQHAGTQKHKARNQLGPVWQTPNSDEQKHKERRQRTIYTPNHNLASTDVSTGGPMYIMAETEAMDFTDIEREEETFVTVDSTLPTTQVPAETNKAQDEPHMSTTEQKVANANRRKPLKHIVKKEGSTTV